MIREFLRSLFRANKAPVKSLPLASPEIHPFVARYLPPTYDENQSGYPEGHLLPAWEAFKQKRAMLEPFRHAFEEKFQQAEPVGHYNFFRTIKKTVGGNQYSIYHEDSEFLDGLLHKDGCPKRDRANHANGWEYWYQGGIKNFRIEMANLLLENSLALRKILSEQQGLWWEYLKTEARGWMASGGKTVYERPEHLVEPVYLLLLRTDAIFFESLMPEFFTELRRSSEKWKVIVRRSRGREEKVLDTHDTIKQLVLEIVDELNERREECPHFDYNFCSLCEMQVKPDLKRNLGLNVPNEICAWCYKVIDYHHEPLLYAGKSKEQVRDEALEGFRLAVAELNFPFWRSGIATSSLLKSLNMRRASPRKLRELVSITAAMPRDLCGFKSDLHFINASGLENISHNPKSRGKKSISSCGHVCLSMGERDICEHLFSQGIPHSREPYYGDMTGEKGVTEFGGMRGDFLIGDTVFEFAGMAGNAEYDMKMTLKQQLAEGYGIDLKVIYPNQLSKLGEIFDEALSSSVEANTIKTDRLSVTRIPSD